MVAVSHEVFNRIVDEYGDRMCYELLHPHERSCLKAQKELLLVSLKGSAKYFFLMYLAQNAIRYKSLTTADVKPIVISYIRSLGVGVWCVCAAVGSACIYRNVNGQLSKGVLSYLMGLSSGLSVYCSDEKRRPIMAYTLAACAVEALLRRLYRKVKRSKTIETLAFMVLNGILMYKMRVTELARCSRDMWFFRPNRLKVDKEVEETVDAETGEIRINACPHTDMGCTTEQCLHVILKETSKYYVGALIFTVVKLLFTKPKLRRSPTLLLKAITQWKNLQLSCFFGWYVGVYQAVSCLLCRWRKRDEGEHALVAGFFAGLSYGINSNLTLLASIFLYVARILGREFQRKYNISKIPFVELNMILAMGVLVNGRIFDPESTPGGFKFMLDTITQSKLNVLFTQFLQVVEAQKATDMRLGNL